MFGNFCCHSVITRAEQSWLRKCEYIDMLTCLADPITYTSTEIPALVPSLLHAGEIENLFNTGDQAMPYLNLIMTKMLQCMQNFAIQEFVCQY